MFSGLQIENMYTCKTYIFGNRVFNVCKCQNMYSLFVGVRKGIIQDLAVEDANIIDADRTQNYG